MPLTRQQALDHFHSPDLIGLGFEADAVRRRLHPEDVVTYIIDRNINYTNYCTEFCTFCAFYRPLLKNGKPDPRVTDGYILDFEKIYEKLPRPSRWAAPACSCRAASIPISRSIGLSGSSPASSSVFRKSGCIA